MCTVSKEYRTVFYHYMDSIAVRLGECDSIVKAVDCLFKAHYVFWLDYVKALCFYGVPAEENL